MKRKLQFLKTLLVAVGMCAGASDAWGVEVTETYDFKTFCQTNGAPTLTMGSTVAATQSGTSTNTGGDLYLIENPTSNEQTLQLNNRFAIDYGPSSAVQIRFMWRKDDSSDAKRGLAGNWGGNNQTANGACHLSILDLKVGDKVKITYAFSNAAAKPTTCAANFLTGIAADVALVSGTEYTVASAGNLDLYFPNNNFGINSIVIKTTGTEEFDTNPVVAVTGANNGDRTITITSPKTNAENNSVTYYTKDGSTPTSSSTLYSGAFTVTSSDIVEGKVTIKAIAYKEGDTSVASEVTTLVLNDVGTTLTLNAPTIALSSFTLNSFYNPTYTFTSNQSNITGAPTATVKYSFAGGDAVEAGTYTVTSPGRLTVTVSADGYNSNSAYVDVANVNFTKTYSFDAIDDVTIDTSTGTWTNATNVNSAQWTFADLGSATYTLRADITLNTFMYARKTTGAVKNGFYTRTGAGSIGYTIASDEYILFTMLDETFTVADGSKTSQAFAQHSNVRAINIYTPLPATTVALSDGDAKHLTFHNATSGTNAWENWQIALYGNGGKAAHVRADWWDDVAGNNLGFTYGYTYSTDGGVTADNTNWGTNFMTDMANADIDLTLSYTGGTFYVIGTMTKGADVYYVNFSKAGLSGTVYYDLVSNNATLTDINTATTSVLTTPAHPTNVAVAVGTNGYATYANNVYPLDLTSATAYKAAIVGDVVKFTLFEQAVPAGTGMLVAGSGTVNLPIADASTTVTGNAFLVNASGNNFAAEANTTYYAMIKDSDPLTFGTFAPATLAFPANKAYLKVVSGGAPSLTAIFDDGNTTGINAVKNAQFTENGEYYNLAGQRVAQPTKGLYIVNGRKVVVK